MKYLKVLLLGTLLSASVVTLLMESVASADEQTSQCQIMGSMAGTVQRMRIEYDVTHSEMIERANKHTPPELLELMIVVIDGVYDYVPFKNSPEKVFKAYVVSCLGTEV